MTNNSSNKNCCENVVTAPIIILSIVMTISVFYSGNMLPIESYSVIVNDNNDSNNNNQNNIDAKSIYENETLIVPSDVSNFIILIPNEAHESIDEEKHKLISDHNSYFIPTNLVISKGTNISFFNADAPWDTPHPHTIILKEWSLTDSDSEDNEKEEGNIVYTSVKLDYTNATESFSLNPGKYSVTDKVYTFSKGSITVLDNNNATKDSTKNRIMGGFYSPTFKVEKSIDNDGFDHPGSSLSYYKNEFAANGLKIESMYNFTYTECSYCAGEYWPDNKTGEHTLIIFSTDKNFEEVIQILQKLTRDNVYV